MKSEETISKPPEERQAAVRTGPASPGRWRSWLAYVLAFTTMVATALALMALGPNVRSNTPLIVFVVPVILGAYLGGLVPGLVSTAVVVVGSVFFILPPVYSWRVASPADNIKWVALLLAGVLISSLSEALHRSRQRVEELCLALARDVSERKRGEEALTTSELRYRRLFEAAQDGILILDAETGQITDVNPFLTNLLGYSHQEFLGKRLWDIGPFKDIAASTASKSAFHKLQEQEYVRFDDLPLETADRGRIEAELVSNVYRVDGTKVIQCNIRDITERKQAEAALHLRTKALEAAANGILIADRQGSIIWVNAAITTLTGYNAEELIGRNPRILKSGKQDLKFYENLWTTILAGKVWHGELINRRKDGSLYTEEQTITPVRDERGEISHFIAIKQDVTARKHLEEIQRQTEKLGALGTLAGGIAHDFNNLLLAMSGNTKLAIAELPPDHPAQVSLAEISKAGARARQLVQRILAFSRPQVPERTVVQLEPVVEEALKLVRPILPAMIEIRTDFAPGLPAVGIDPGQVHQVIVNLASNAAQAIGQRRGLIEFRLEAVNVSGEHVAVSPSLQEGHYVRLSVSDNGCGMDRDTLERIFDPFFTTKGPGEGTGLGLSVVHGIMKSQGGTATVYSEPGSGTMFRLYFPAGEGAVETAPVKPREIHRERSEHVLYVDDEAALVFLVTRVLERLGYKVTGLTDAAEALEAFRSKPGDFDVVVTDLAMPNIAGFELASEMLAVRPTIPIIMTSGYLRPEDEERARRVGILKLILKPDTADELGQTLDALFQKAYPVRANE